MLHKYSAILLLFFLSACANIQPQNQWLGGQCGQGHTDIEIECRVKQALSPIATKPQLEQRVQQNLQPHTLSIATAHVALAQRLTIALNSQVQQQYLDKMRHNQTPLDLSDTKQDIVGLIGQVMGGKQIDSVAFGVSVLNFITQTGMRLLPAQLREPTQVSLMVLQQGIKNKGFSDNFEQLLQQSFAQAIDLAGIQQAWQRSSLMSKISDPYNTLLAGNLHIDKLSDLFLSIYKIKQNTSLSGTVAMLKHVNGLDSLKKTATLSQIFKDSTPAVFDFLGADVYNLL